MANTIEWEKHHVFMRHPGWCGVYTIKMIFNACGIRKSIYEIALYTWKWWYGSPYILIVSYLNKFFTLVNYRTGATIEDIKKHLSVGHICIINFQDGGDGHYALVTEAIGKRLIIVDSSNERDWTYAMTYDELREKWYDNLSDSLWHERLLIWLNPLSKRTE
jgi:hypothetical protein